ncbi:helix-turn-helix domain-containing protein [Weissella cibaria]|uniref:HTH cro/C1-type domain-containing protein n=2 Tax=Weissella cibaria TaxID=137591 RepID=A0A2S1KPW6_9LACO|nr:helix-turn-helix transcriptional regulator [Weissella cibaria]AWF95057.1 hypothetical protein B6254_0636 [Weissella cibaria]
MTQTLAERINEIRRNKQVSVQTIVANGISKSKYFAYMRGERDLSIRDLQILMDLLTVSFAELVIDTDVIPEPYNLNLLRARNLTVDQLETFRDVLQAKYAQSNLVAHRQYGLAFNYLVAYKSDADCKPDVTALYDELKNYRVFTFFEMQLFSLIAESLTPKRFYRLYEIFVQSIGLFSGYMPMPIYLTILRIHYYALVHLTRPSLKSWPTMLFVLEAIENQPARPSNIELFMLREFAKMLKAYYTVDSPAAEQQFRSWLNVAIARGVVEIKLTYDTLSFPGLWQALTMKRSHMAVNGKSMFTTDYAHIQSAELADNFGDALQILLKGKRITGSELEQYGITRSKLYRIMHQDVVIRLNDLFEMMTYLRLLPADLTVFFFKNPTSRARERFAAFLVDPTDYQTVVTEALDHYEVSHSNADYETALEFQVYVNQQLSDFDPTSIVQLDLARTIKDYLLKLDEWHEAEHRLVMYSFIDIDDVEMVIKRLRIADEYMHHRNVFRAPISSVLNNAEYSLLKAVILNQRADFDKIMTVVAGERERDPQIFHFATWRWRVDVFDYYEMMFTNPAAGLAAFETFVTDYQVLTGKPLFPKNRNFIADTLKHHFATVLKGADTPTT